MGFDQVQTEETVVPDGRRLALLICNGEFPLKPQWNLPGVAKDAEKIRDVLVHPDLCGFEVSTVLNGGLVEVRREIAKLCASAQEHDTVLIYYSGQGACDYEQRLHLLVADSDAEHYLATGLEPNFILDQLRKADCRSVVLVVDACHAGAFFTGNRGIPNGLYAVTSCGTNQIAHETREGGAFSLAVVEGLRGGAADRDGDGRVTIEELHAYVQKRVAAEYSEQTPQKWEWNVPGPIYMTSAQRPVFLSYSRDDSPAAIALKTALEAEGLKIWMDTDSIRSGDWKDRIFEGLDDARAFLLLMTASSLGSEVVKKEVALAARKKVPLIPVQIGEPDIPTWFDFDYGHLHRYFLNPEDSAPAVEGLRNAINDASVRAVGDTERQDASQPLGQSSPRSSRTTPSP